MIIKEKDNRLFLQHGPIDIVIEAIGKDKSIAYEKVKTYFKNLLSELVLELELLKKEVKYNRQFTNQIAQKIL